MIPNEIIEEFLAILFQDWLVMHRCDMKITWEGLAEDFGGLDLECDSGQTYRATSVGAVLFDPPVEDLQGLA
ncbi:hypothetical protein V6N13_032373 [Hibiscus sabdariffa]